MRIPLYPFFHCSPYKIHKYFYSYSGFNFHQLPFVSAYANNVKRKFQNKRDEMANKIKNLTINDLDKQSFIEYKTQVYKKIEPILLKHFSTKELQCLGKQNYFWKCMFGEKKFCRYDGKTFDSIIRYSTRKQTIPLDFDCVMTVVLEKDLTTTGIFRISTNYVQLDQVEKEMFRLISMNVIRDDILDFLRNYDIVMLTTLFSRLFSHYKTSLFPNGLLDIAMKAVTIPDEQEKFKIFKMILLAFPHTKRTMLESVGKFIKTVSDTNINADKSKSRSMTLNGICKVLAPRMFLSCNQKIQIQDLFVYIEILDYIFGNMPTIIELENILNTRHKSFKFK